MFITQSPSKNSYGRGGYKPELIVIHCTEGFYPSDLEWLRGLHPQSQVSSSYYISPKGDVHQLVPDDKAAWHAGTVDRPTARLLKVGAGGKVVNPNLYTIGIEISLHPPAQATPEQWDHLKKLVKLLADRHGIPIDRDHIIGHHEIRASKPCPSPIVVDQLVKDIQTGEMTTMPDPSREEIKQQIINLVNRL